MTLDELAEFLGVTPRWIYDNHKASRMRRRLPLADSALVAAIADQQTWVATRFPAIPRSGSLP